MPASGKQPPGYSIHMNLLMDLRILLILAAILATCQLLALAVAAYYGENLWPIIGSMTVGFAGLALLPLTRTSSMRLHPKDGFLVAALGWMLASVLGGLPFVFSGQLGWIDAIFETASGLTTTGSSVIPDVEILPRGLLLWRQELQWIGGMGMILLVTAILPYLGIGGTELINAEVPGPSKDKLVPRLATSGRLLWGLYIGFTAAATVSYYLAGMSWYDAINHAFSSLATGGYSTRNSSFMAFSPAAQWLSVLYMGIAGGNFVLYYRLFLRGDTGIFRDPEFRLYIAIIVSVSLTIAFTLMAVRQEAFEPALRAGFFQTVTIMTTTGYASADWEQWPLVLQLLLLILMLIGGMAGSTAGGIKVVRLAMLGKLFSVTAQRLLRPNQVIVAKLGGQEVENSVLQASVTMAALAIFVILFTTVVLTALGMDLVSASTAALTAVSNVGPGLGTVGPYDNFSGVADAGKLLLSLAMITGRLEFFTVLLLFTPYFWKR
jgi:trk system potassium uptake protein TrkH